MTTPPDRAAKLAEIRKLREAAGWSPDEMAGDLTNALDAALAIIDEMARDVERKHTSLVNLRAEVEVLRQQEANARLGAALRERWPVVKRELEEGWRLWHADARDALDALDPLAAPEERA